MIDMNSFDEIAKAKASIGEVRVWSDGIARKKEVDGTWVPVEKNYKNSQIVFRESKFGENYSQYAGKPKEALDFLIAKKNGQVKNVWERKDIGDIDIVYGKKNFGLKHIVGKHVGVTENGKEKDFKDEEELSSTIDKLLREGKLIKDFVDGNGFRKRILSLDKHVLVITQTIVVDEEDNFKEKRWIVTSYDPTRTMKEKGIKKAISSKIAFEKEVNSSSPLQHSSEKGVTLSTFSLDTLVSWPKDTVNINMGQQFMDEIIEKAKKPSPIGTEKKWGSKVYIKTVNGWRPKGERKESSKEDEESKTDSRKVDYSQHASKASDKQLQAAVNDEYASSEVKQAAQEEIDKRQKQKEDEETQKKEVLKKEIFEEVNKKIGSVTGFHKITQTYVKVNGKTIVVKMKGDNQYKATSPGFKMESKPYENLKDFKERIKEEFAKNTEKETIEEKQKPAKLHFKNEEETQKFMIERNSQKSELTEEESDALKKAFDYPIEGMSTDFETKIRYYIKNNKFQNILGGYAGANIRQKKSINKMLVENGFLPITDGVLFSKWKDVEYKIFEIDADRYVEDMNKRKVFYNEEGKENFENATRYEKDSLDDYQGTAYIRIRNYLVTGSTEGDVEIAKVIPPVVEAISSFIDKNPIRNNIVLYRRMSLPYTDPNGLNEWIGAEVGDIIEDKSFSSFSLKQQSGFGNDLQITLLAKKGDPVANINNRMEYEYLTQKSTKYKVLAKGTNSIMVEIV